MGHGAAAGEGAANADGAARGPGFAAGAALLAVGLLVFYRDTLDLYFLGDDFVFLDRSRVASWREGLALFGVEKSGEGLDDVHHAWRPVSTNLYFGGLWALFGLEPRPFHLANLGLLLANALLLQRLLRALGSRPATALGVAWVYATCSASFDGQLWLSVAQDLLLTTTAFACTAAYLAWRRSDRRRAGLAALAAFALALLCKESAVALLPLLAGVEALVVRRGAGPALRRLAPFAALAGGYAVFRLGAIGLPSGGPYALRFDAVLFENGARYLGWTGEALLFASTPLAPVAMAGAAAAAVLSGGRPARRRLAALGALWFPVALLPVLFLADHAYRFYLTLPLAGAAMLAAAGIDALADRLRRPGALLALATAALVLFTGLSQRRLAASVAHFERRGVLMRGLLTQLRERLPEVPDGTRFYFVLPATLPRNALLKHSGAALRVLYDNRTLAAHRLPEPTPGAPHALRSGPGLVFRLTEAGVLLPLHPPPRAVRDG